HGHFTDVTRWLAPELEHVGMVTDAIWRDVDGDGRPDLIVVGEWMPITVFHNAGGGKLVRRNTPGLEHSEGWWNRIIAGDFTGNGRVDFIVGNVGWNTRLHASEAEPMTMYVKDFNGSGASKQIISLFHHGTSYPIAMRDELIAALPYLKARYPRYADYAGQTVSDIFSPAELAGATFKQARTLATMLARNNGDGSFTLVPLPRAAQLARASARKRALAGIRGDDDHPVRAAHAIHRHAGRVLHDLDGRDVVWIDGPQRRAVSQLQRYAVDHNQRLVAREERADTVNLRGDAALEGARHQHTGNASHQQLLDRLTGHALNLLRRPD